MNELAANLKVQRRAASAPPGVLPVCKKPSPVPSSRKGKAAVLRSVKARTNAHTILRKYVVKSFPATH